MTTFLARILSLLATVLALPTVLQTVSRRLRTQLDDPDRGSSSTELIIIILGIVVIAGIVIAIVTAFVNRKAGELG
jgi:predicted permease